MGRRLVFDLLGSRESHCRTREDEPQDGLLCKMLNKVSVEIQYEEKALREAKSVQDLDFYGRLKHLCRIAILWKTLIQGGQAR